MNAVKCKPNFDDDSGNIFRIGPLVSPSKVQIYLPSTMTAATTQLQGAINQWNARLPSTVQFEIVTSSCGNGPACITITTMSQEDCGSSFANYDTLTGVITGNTVIRLRPTWNTAPDNYSAQGLRRTFIHELGHLLGLKDSDVTHCEIPDAAMQDQFNCAAESVMQDVKFDDWSPVVNASYGGKTKATCGW